MQVYVMFNVKIKQSSVQYFIPGHNTNTPLPAISLVYQFSYSHWSITELLSVFSQPLYYVVRCIDVKKRKLRFFLILKSKTCF